MRQRGPATPPLLVFAGKSHRTFRRGSAGRIATAGRDSAQGGMDRSGRRGRVSVVAREQFGGREGVVGRRMWWRGCRDCIDYVDWNVLDRRRELVVGGGQGTGVSLPGRRMRIDRFRRRREDQVRLLFDLGSCPAREPFGDGALLSVDEPFEERKVFDPESLERLGALCLFRVEVGELGGIRITPRKVLVTSARVSAQPLGVGRSENRGPLPVRRSSVSRRPRTTSCVPRLP